MKLERLHKIAQEECQLIPGQALIVGVSGGPDSLCLLDSLARLGFSLIVAHFDHRLRPESGQDAAVVRSVAERLGFPFRLGSQDVAAYAQKERLSIEEAARLLRYRFLFAEARLHSAQAVAVGHTADDQVETVLMHLLRGSGLAGLTGMAYRSLIQAWDPNIPLVRPLLSFWRVDIMAYCIEHGLPAVTDVSNQDVSFYRNRLRQELIPYLETYNPQIRQVLWRMAQVLSGEEAVVHSAVERAWKACCPEQETEAVFINLAAFQALEVGLQRGVLRRAVALLIPDLRDVDFDVIDRGLQFLNSGRQGQVDLLKGLRLFVEGQRLVIAAPDGLKAAHQWPQLIDDLVLPIPGQVDLPAGWRMTSEWVERPRAPEAGETPGGTAWEAWLAKEKLTSPLLIRRVRPGDRFQPLGMQGHSVKLSDFWINHKLPRRARAAWPLVTDGRDIVWVPGFLPADPFRVTGNTRKMAHLKLFRGMNQA